MKLFPLLFLYEVLSPSISQSQPPKLAIRGLGIKLWQGGGRIGRVSSVGYAMQRDASQQDGHGHPAVRTVLKVRVRVESV